MQRAGLRQIRTLEGTTDISAGKQYTFRHRIEPYQNLDLHKSFFNVIDKVPRVGARVLNDFFGEPDDLLDTDYNNDYDYLKDAHKTKAIVRADNHFINSFGSFRILFNGQVVEEFTTFIGELDCIMKRLNNSKAYNILRDHGNFGLTYRERYVDTKYDKQEYQFIPEFSKFWRYPDIIYGGIDLQIEIVIHPQYKNRVLDTSHGILDFVRDDKTAIGVGANLVTDILTQPTIADNAYELKDLSLFLWIEDNMNLAPKLAPFMYNFSTWGIDRRILPSSTTHEFEFNIRRGIRTFGFAFQNSEVDNNTEISVTDFTGCAKYARGSGNTDDGVPTKVHRTLTFKSANLITYEVEYGKNKLPYSQLTQEINQNQDFTKKQTYVRLLNYGNLFDATGCYTKPDDQHIVDGPFFIENFHDMDSDQSYIKFRFTFPAVTTNLALFFFYEFETTTALNYDATGNCVQVVPSF